MSEEKQSLINSGNRNSGYFNSNKTLIRMFNKETDTKEDVLSYKIIKE